MDKNQTNLAVEPDAGRAVKEIALSRFSDVVNLNAFVAQSPSRARLVYKTSRTGLWQLDLENEGTWWTIGYYIDGMEDREIVYDIVVKKVWRGYVDEELSERHHSPYVLWLAGGYIFIALPHRGKEEIVIVAPQVCLATDPLREPVYIWHDTAYRILDCGGWLYSFKAWEEFEAWIKTRVNHEFIHWMEWYVIPGAVGNEEWLTSIRRAIRGPPYPTADEVFELTRLLIHQP
jgi:hypothetical protein